MAKDGIGAAVRRKEDRRFLIGAGHYTDDLQRPGQVYAHIVRSPHAHARVRSVATKAALAAPGVLGVFTGADLAASKVGSLPAGWLIHNKDNTPMVEPPHPALVTDRVRYVGDAVAVVVAETRAQAREAAALVEVDYEELPAAASLAAAIAPGAPLVWDQAPGNTCYDWHLGDARAVDAAFQKAHKIVALDIVNNRLIPNAIEPRAAIGEYESATGDYTLFTTSQNPHLIRLLMAAFTMGIPEHKLRVVSPDVGGGFGSKIFHYAEEVIVTWAARKVGRPVKWTAQRSESFMSDAHGRDHVTHGELALDKDGRFVGLRVRTLANMGAYLSTFGPAVPTYLYGTLLAGCYTTPAIYCEVRAVFTHTVPVDAYRGAGRPEAAYILERLVDTAARELGIDRADIRRRNFIPPEKFPYATPVALEYDSGNYHATLELALGAADYAGFEKRRAEAKSRGKLRGIGLATYVEACGIAPSAVAGALGARAGLYESALVRVHPTGVVTIFTGSHSHGQGHETAFAQLAAEYLGVSVEQVDIQHGDSAHIGFGMGTYGSRSLAVGGSAIVKALEKVIKKGKKIAAHLLEASESDIEFKDGKYTVVGTDRAKAFAEIAFAAYVPHKYPQDLEPGLEDSAFYDPKNFTFPAGCHVCEIEIDPETGVSQVVAFTVADDVGTVVNPMIVDGQIHGGVAQGIGQALYEACIYDDNGQLITGSYMNYTMPRAADLPFFQVGIHATACTHNPIGAKGCGEVGSIGAPAAVINAVVDALAGLGVRHVEMPATPERVWRAICDAQEGAMRDFTFHRASSPQDAVEKLRKLPEAKLLAGGQSLIPVMKLDLAAPSDLVSIGRIDALRGIKVDGREIVVGAATTHAEVARSAEVRKHIPALAHLAAEIGDPQVRNRGTLGGSIAHNDPAADYPAALVGLGAVVETNTRRIPADDYFKGMFQTALTEGELITAVRFPIPEKAAYAKFPNPASRFAIVGVFVAKTAAGVRVAVTGAGSGVFRAPKMETALGARLAPEAIMGISMPATNLVSDANASAEYRAHLITVMAKRAVAALR